VTVINNTASGVKMMIKHPAFMPTVAIVDPVLTKSLPPHVVAATGIDALSHAIEAYISRLAHPFTNTLALSAIQLIWQNIIRAYRDETDIDAKENMSIASMQAGMAFANSSVCLVHGMSRPIGAYFNVPHGVSNAMLLPGVLEFTKDYAVYRLAALGRMLKPELKTASNETVAETFIYDLKLLCNDLAIPNMQKWGIEQQAYENMLDTMATDAIASGSPNNNLRVATHQEIVDLYRYCYNYSF
jgi:alcohol dehydrogenase class IV